MLCNIYITERSNEERDMRERNRKKFIRLQLHPRVRAKILKIKIYINSTKNRKCLKIPIIYIYDKIDSFSSFSLDCEDKKGI